MIILADKITVNRDLIASQELAPGEVVKIKSDDLTLVSLQEGLSYVIISTRLIARTPEVILANTGGPTSLEIYAGTIVGALVINANGAAGVNGQDGEPGLDMTGDGTQGEHGLPGGNGGKGADGGAGANVLIQYGSATVVPSATSIGGSGGKGGKGGRGGHGVPGPHEANVDGKPGHKGVDGNNGPNGTVSINGVPIAQITATIAEMTPIGTF
jgi:hypothetical protein